MPKEQLIGSLLAVVDNGIGIDDETRDKVFKPKFTTKSSGMGLGLAMSRNIVEGAYGKIWFESKSNEGTDILCSPTLLRTAYIIASVAT